LVFFYITSYLNLFKGFKLSLAFCVSKSFICSALFVPMGTEAWTGALAENGVCFLLRSSRAWLCGGFELGVVCGTVRLAVLRIYEAAFTLARTCSSAGWLADGDG
jgi:hypothetical protein